MLICPSCDNTLDQDFGMVTCSSCKAVLMIDISGQVQVGSEVPDVQEPVFQDDIDDETFDDYQTKEFETSIDESVEEPIEDLEEMDAPFLDNDSEETAPLVESGFEDFVNNEINGDEDQGFDDQSDDITDEVLDETQQAHEFEDEVDEVEEVESFPMADTPDSKPVDITSFANSEVSSLEDGDLLYDVELSRLDSKDLREAFKFILLDEKLKLNHHEFIKKIKDGRVTISNLNPIKAKRIVEQLQYLDVGIKWRQKRVVMETVESESMGVGDEEATDDIDL